MSKLPPHGPHLLKLQQDQSQDLRNASGQGPDSSEKRVQSLRRAQVDWREIPVRKRALIIGNVSNLLADRFESIVHAIQLPEPRPLGISLAAEVMPFADACCFLRQRASRILSARTLSNSDRPSWVGKVSVRIHREPLGVVLVLGTWNYPLFLPGVQIAQALVAGNAVALKPAPGTEDVSQKLCELFWDSGVPRSALQILPSTVQAARDAISSGVDRVVLTGSSTTGRAILSQLTETLTPATLELSGCDALYVLPSADLNRVADAIIWGLRLNGGATCIAPRRVFVMPDQQRPLQQRLVERLRFSPPINVHPPALKLMRELVDDACRGGAEILVGDESIRALGDSSDPENNQVVPLVITKVLPSMRLVQSDLFAPIVSLITVHDWTEAITADRQCPYALCASIFGSASEAEQRASQIEAGCVVINDVIAPTADPRVPFGGRGESGYGVTRGAEGLLEMTRIKSICQRHGNWLPHLDPPQPTDEKILVGLLRFSHGKTWRDQWRGICDLWAAVQERRTENK